MGGELEIGTEIVEVRSVRWRYVKGGLRMVMVLCAGSDLFSKSAVCDDTASAETDFIARASMVSIHVKYEYFKNRE